MKVLFSCLWFAFGLFVFVFSILILLCDCALGLRLFARYSDWVGFASRSGACVIILIAFLDTTS